MRIFSRIFVTRAYGSLRQVIVTYQVSYLGQVRILRWQVL